MAKQIKYTDIIVTTRNRLDGLKRCLSYLYGRTRSPYKLTVMDDASTEGNVDYLLDEFRAGRVHHLVLRGDRVGAMAQLNVGTWMAFSDPVVFTDDDILCPDVEPDWLARGLDAMQRHKGVALLALNHPRARRRITHVQDDVTYCRYVGGTFMFCRRKFLMNFWLPHYRDNFGVTPTTTRCQKARARGWLVGYLTETYCHHMETWSTLTEREHNRAREVEDFDPVTLEPTNPRFRY